MTPKHSIPTANDSTATSRSVTAFTVCLGAALARLEAVVALKVLAERIDSIGVVEPDTLRYGPSFILRGLEGVQVDPHLPVGRASRRCPSSAHGHKLHRTRAVNAECLNRSRWRRPCSLAISARTLIHVERFHPLDDVFEGMRWKRAGLREQLHAVAEDHQRRDRANLERPGDLLLRLGVDLRE